jgi:hypothetical protein
MSKTVVLSVGDVYHLGRGRDHIVYSGMSSRDVFSITQRKREITPIGYNAQAWNLFFPKEQERIRVDGVNIMVDSVTPDEIRLRL